MKLSCRYWSQRQQLREMLSPIILLLCQASSSVSLAPDDSLPGYFDVALAESFLAPVARAELVPGMISAQNLPLKHVLTRRAISVASRTRAQLSGPPRGGPHRRGAPPDPTSRGWSGGILSAPAVSAHHAPSLLRHPRAACGSTFRRGGGTTQRVNTVHGCDETRLFLWVPSFRALD